MPLTAAFVNGLLHGPQHQTGNDVFLGGIFNILLKPLEILPRHWRVLFTEAEAKASDKGAESCELFGIGLGVVAEDKGQAGLFDMGGDWFRWQPA